MIKRLPLSTFLKTFKNVPRLALNLIITKQGMVLLTKRGKPPLVGSWHIPGSFLLKNEKINDCLIRIAKDELGFRIDPSEVKFLGVFEDLEGDPRGHVIDIMYGVEISNLGLIPIGDTKEIAFFSKLPGKIGFNHKETLNKLGFK